METLKILEPYIDNRYKNFIEHLSPTATLPFLGIRIPILRKLARETKDYSFTPHYHEEVHLRGFIISGLKIPFSEKIPLIESQLPYLASWDLTDSFAPSLKPRKEDSLEEMYSYFSSLLTRPEVYTRRLGIIWLKCNAKKLDRYPELISMFSRIEDDDYYISMAIAWTLQEFCMEVPALVEENLNHFKPETVQRFRQKMRDSRRKG